MVQQAEPNPAQFLIKDLISDLLELSFTTQFDAVVTCKEKQYL